MDSTGTLSNTTRFSLPVDLLTLESECDKYGCRFFIMQIAGMTPTDYLHSHCVIRYVRMIRSPDFDCDHYVCSFRRTSYYNKVFKRTDRDKDGRISLVVRIQDAMCHRMNLVFCRSY